MSQKLQCDKASDVPKSVNKTVPKKRGWDNRYKIEKGLSIGTRQDQSSGIFYARLYIDGRDKVYSLATTSKTDAIIKAAKLKENVDINGKKVIVRKKKSGKRRVLVHTKWDRFMEYKRGQVKAGAIKKTRLGIYNAINKNWFGKYIRNNRCDFEQINEQFVYDFWEWRTSYYGSLEHKKDVRKAREEGEKLLIKETGAHGLDNERKIIKEFLIWSFRMEYTKKGVPIALDEKPKAIGESAEGFSYEEYTKLQKAFGPWIVAAGNDVDVQNTRKRVYLKFKLMLACGTRTADLIQLQWKDVQNKTDPHTGEVKRFFWAKAKNKRRRSQVSKELWDELMQWKEDCKFSKPDDFVFSTQTGKTSATDNNKWKIFLKENDCLLDPNGKARNMTSLRHTFASFAILYTDEKTSVVAERMGTSERQVEETYKDDLSLRDTELFTKQLVPMLQEHDKLRDFADGDADVADGMYYAMENDEKEIQEDFDDMFDYILKEIEKGKREKGIIS